MRNKQRGLSTIGVVLVIILVLLLFGFLPLGWPAYGPPGLVFVALLVVLVLIFNKRL